MITVDRKLLARTLARLTPYTGGLYHWQRLVRIAVDADCDPGHPAVSLQAANGADFAGVLLPCETEDSDCIVAVPLELLRAVVAASAADSISLSMSGSHLVVRDDASRTRILGQPAADVPPFPESPCDGSAMVLSGRRDLCDAIGAAASTAAAESARYAVSAVMVRRDGMVVSTDGRVLQSISASATAAPAAEAAGVDSILVPSRLAAEIARWPHCDLHHAQGRVYACCDGDDGAWIAGTAASGHAFPPWESVMPKEPGEHSISGDADAIAAALRAASAMTDDGSPGVRLRLSGGAASIEARSARAGEATVAVPCVVHGDAEIGLNAAQAMRLIKASGAVADGDLTIRFGAATKPITYRRGDAWQAVQMPTAMS